VRREEPPQWGGDPRLRRRASEALIDTMIDLHAVDWVAIGLADLGRPDGFIARQVKGWAERWERAKDREVRQVTDVARWLAERIPRPPGATLVHGDLKLDNVMLDPDDPRRVVAVLDWEMAGLGPRELDLAWLVFAHRVFEHLAGRFGAPGMPHFMRADDACAAYERKTGHTPRDLDFYAVYCAVQWGIVFLRTGYRAVHFGEREMPDDPDEFFHCRELFEEVIT
jgi:aminoglycoside phosphotransferase (APT) family kinase protein